MKILFLVLLFSLLCYSDSYRILVCFPLYVKSLTILGQGIVRHLLNDGHEVTYITTHPMKMPQTKNFRQIDISDNNLFKDDDSLKFSYIMENEVAAINYQFMQKMGSDNARLTFQNKKIIELLEDTNEYFDAVIVDLFESEVYAGLAVLYNCPMIWAYSMGAHWQVLRLISDPGNPSYDADYLGHNILPLTFAQRIEELWARIRWTLYKTYVTMPIEREIYEEAFRPLLAKRGRELPDYDDVVFNASLIFGNEHNAIISRPSTPQNFKYIGGFHIEDPVKPLPKDLQDLMDKATDGVIYFSMGTFWKSKEMPMKLTRALLDMFGELKQTVIWKYEDDLKEVPKNVRLVQWAPQPSILAHPNCKFFITHGGLLSSIESVHFGVPIIGIPILLDQHTNINKAVANGYALKVDLNYYVPENLKKTINIMLSDDTYRNRVKELSAIYHDVPVKPGIELAHWVRHVVRTGGAPHLRSPAANIPLYQRLYLDLAALVLAIVFLLSFSLLSLCMRSKKSIKKVKKN